MLVKATSILVFLGKLHVFIINYARIEVVDALPKSKAKAVKDFAINRIGFVFHENRRKLRLRQIIAGFSKFRDSSLEFSFAKAVSGFHYIFLSRSEQKYRKVVLIVTEKERKFRS